MWGFRNKSSSNDKGRKKHVQSLMSRNGRLYTVIQQNRNSYKISFKTRMGENSFTILIIEKFPEIAPRLYCEPKYSHPWLDTNGNIVGIDELNRWSQQYSDLGRIVQSAVMQFTASPPTLKQQQHGAKVSNNAYKPVATLPAAKPPPPSYQKHQELKKQESMLDMRSIKFSIPQNIDKLDELSTEQIDEMVKEPKLIEEFAYSVASGLREMRESQQNEILNCKIIYLKNKTRCRCSKIEKEIDNLSTVYSQLKQRQDKELQKFSKQRLNAELKSEIEKSDQATNDLKEKFDEGDLAPLLLLKNILKNVKIIMYCKSKKKIKLILMMNQETHRDYNKYIYFDLEFRKRACLF